MGQTYVLCISVCLLQCSMEQRKKHVNWRDNWQLIRTVWSLCRTKPSTAADNDPIQWQQQKDMQCVIVSYDYV